MLSPALLNVADRLIATLMTLVDAIFPIALSDGTPTFPEYAAHTLYLRLTHLIATLIRISNFGIRAPARPAAPKNPTQPTPSPERTSPAQTLPRHPGWLLEALPDIAPAIASDLAALLADPALATLLADTPTLQRALRPLLRSLGLTQSPPAPDPGSPAPSPRFSPQPPHPARPGLPQPGPQPKPHLKTHPIRQTLSTPKSLRYNNENAEITAPLGAER